MLQSNPRPCSYVNCLDLVVLRGPHPTEGVFEKEMDSSGAFFPTEWTRGHSSNSSVLCASLKIVQALCYIKKRKKQIQDSFFSQIRSPRVPYQWLSTTAPSGKLISERFRVIETYIKRATHTQPLRMAVDIVSFGSSSIMHSQLICFGGCG